LTTSNAIECEQDDYLRTAVFAGVHARRLVQRIKCQGEWAMGGRAPALRRALWKGQRALVQRLARRAAPTCKLQCYRRRRLLSYRLSGMMPSCLFTSRRTGCPRCNEGGTRYVRCCSLHPPAPTPFFGAMNNGGGEGYKGAGPVLWPGTYSSQTHALMQYAMG
jgi:hypothetical protein